MKRYLIPSVFIAFGCQVGEQGQQLASDQSVVLDESPRIELSAATSESVYQLLEVAAAFDGAHRRNKHAQGSLDCVQLAPWSAPASYHCQLDDLLEVEEGAAREIYEKLDVPAGFDGAYRTTKSADVKFFCTRLISRDDEASYTCEVELIEEDRDDNGFVLDRDDNGRKAKIDLEGEKAIRMFQSLQVPGGLDGPHRVTKNAQGQLNCLKLDRGIKIYSCRIGASTIEGEAARVIYEKLDVPAGFDGAHRVSKDVTAQISCAKVYSPQDGGVSYSCTVTYEVQ